MKVRALSFMLMLAMSIGVLTGGGSASAATHISLAPMSTPSCAVGWTCWYEWHVVAVTNNTGYRHGSWRDCVHFHRASVVQHITCSTSKSTSNTATASVTGEWPVGKGKLSAVVGYSVTKTTTVTAEETYDVPAKHKGGTIQWAPRYYRLKTVTQRAKWCGSTYKVPKVCKWVNRYAYAHTEKYDCPDYRIVWD